MNLNEIIYFDTDARKLIGYESTSIIEFIKRNSKDIFINGEIKPIYKLSKDEVKKAYKYFAKKDIIPYELEKRAYEEGLI